MPQTHRTFELWKADVDRWVEKLCGMTTDDIDDYEYQGAYLAGELPERVAREAINNAANACGLKSLFEE